MLIIQIHFDKSFKAFPKEHTCHSILKNRSKLEEWTVTLQQQEPDWKIKQSFQPSQRQSELNQLNCITPDSAQ